MNSVKPVSDNIESLSDNVKKDVVLYDDSRLDRNKNKLILYNFNSYKKFWKILWISIWITISYWIMFTRSLTSCIWFIIFIFYFITDLFFVILIFPR